MSAEPVQRKTITIVPRKTHPEDRPIWPTNENAKTAVRELQEGEMVQLAIDFEEEEIIFVESHKGVDPDSIATYFASPSPLIYSFYRYPRTDTVVLLWTRHDGAISVKKIRAQLGVKLDMIAIAENEGIKVAHEMKVQSQDQISGHRLREEVFSSLQ